jgi:hypothetical protein
VIREVALSSSLERQVRGVVDATRAEKYPEGFRPLRVEPQAEPEDSAARPIQILVMAVLRTARSEGAERTERSRLLAIRRRRETLERRPPYGQTVWERIPTFLDGSRAYGSPRRLPEDRAERSRRRDALRTHPVVTIGGLLQEHPFYVDPDELLLEIREEQGTARVGAPVAH